MCIISVRNFSLVKLLLKSICVLFLHFVFNIFSKSFAGRFTCTFYTIYIYITTRLRVCHIYVSVHCHRVVKAAVVYYTRVAFGCIL